MKRNRFHLTLAAAGIVSLAAMFSAAVTMAQSKSLVSVKTDAAPTLDGKIDAAWSKAAPLAIELTKLAYEPADYKGAKKTNITIRSLYDNENIYFLVQWSDPTKSLERHPWVKQADGSWKVLKKLDDTDHDNTYYEDKMAMLWNINTAGFESRGCAVVCHRARGGKNAGVDDKSPGRKYTNKAGETVDMWHWKGVRNGPVGQIDDQFIDDTKDPTKNADWGRKGDDKTGGGYSDNVNAAKNGPAFMNKNPSPENKYWVLDDQKVPFADTFKAGDVVPGIVVAPFTGPRGDIPAHAAWADGMWTVEFSRKLVTAGEHAKTQSVQFTDLKKTYPFGISVFDNTQINHLYHEGAYQLTFK